MLDQNDLKELVDSLANDPAFTERDNEIEQQRLLVHQQRKVVIPNVNINMEFRTPELRDAANKFKNHMLAAPIKINVAALTEKEGAIRKARNQENFYYRYYEKWRTASVFDGPLFNTAAFGISYLYLRLNADLLPEVDADFDKFKEEIERFTQSERSDIFVLGGLQPDTVYYTPARDYYCHKAEIPLPSLQRQYAKKGMKLYSADGTIILDAMTEGEQTPSSWGDSALLYTIADQEHVYHLIMDKASVAAGKTDWSKGATRTYKNCFGMIPFFDIPGEKTGDPNPRFAHVPLIDGLYQTGPYKNLVYTAKLSAGMDTATQRYALEKIDPNTPEPEGTLEVSVTESGVLLPPDGYRVVNPGIFTGPDLADAVQLIDTETQRYQFPDAIGQPSEVTASSGYERGRIEDTVRSLLDPPLGHFASALGQVFKALGQGVKGIGVPIPVRNIRTSHAQGQPQAVQDLTVLRPDDVIDADISVQMKAETTFTQIAKQEEGLKLMESGVMHKTEFLERVRGVDDLEAWNERYLLDKVETFAEERALTDAQAVIDALRGVLAEEAINESEIDPLVQNSDLSRPDRGPSVPLGPGSAMPVEPTPPFQGVT